MHFFIRILSTGSECPEITFPNPEITFPNPKHLFYTRLYVFKKIE